MTGEIHRRLVEKCTIEKCTCPSDTWLNLGTLASYSPRSVTKISGPRFLQIQGCPTAGPTNVVVTKSRRVKARFVD